MKTHCIITLLFSFLIVTNLFAQLPKKTDGHAMKAIITEIASDEYKGRATGTPEGIKSEEFVAAEFKKLGLKPAGENESYFHTFTYSDYEPDKTELTIDGRSLTSGYDLDFQLMYYSDGGEAEGEIVFAGYGINSPKMKRNDFDSLDIRDKIVLIRRGCPDNNLESWGIEAVDSVKALYCYNQGAKAVLFFSPTNYNIKQLNISDNWIASTEVIKDFPIYLIEDHVVKFIFSIAGSSYYRMMNTIDYKNVSFNTGKIAKLKASVKNKKGNARNVLAMLPGSDPKLKNEYIIIGGHLDHVGVNANNEIRNGADDNASGPAVMLGIARAMVKNKFKPKRTIVFAAWMGEEMGLLGSAAWCEKPTLDIYKTVVYFNLDMVGLGDGNLNMPGTLYAPEITAFIKENTDSIALKKINWSDGGLGGSDHNYFLKKGIPAFAGMTSGNHPDYHQPEDDADKIDADILQFVGDFIYHSTEILAKSKKNFISQSRFDENRSQLMAARLFTPISASKFVESIGQESPKIAVVDFTQNLNDNYDQNLTSILNSFDKAEQQSKKNGKMEFKTTAYDIISYGWWGRNTALIPAFNPHSIGYNEVYFKTLAKSGFKLGILDENFMNYADTTEREKFITSMNNQLVGIVLDNQDLDKMKFVLEKSKSPVMILNKANNVIDENLLSIIKDKKHLVVLQVNNKMDIKEFGKSVKALESKLGNKLVAITCEGTDNESIANYKQQLVELDKALGSEERNQLTYDNYSNFMVKSLQEYPIKVVWRPR